MGALLYHNYCLATLNEVNQRLAARPHFCWAPRLFKRLFSFFFLIVTKTMSNQEWRIRAIASQMRRMANAEFCFIKWTLCRIFSVKGRSTNHRNYSTTAQFLESHLKPKLLDQALNLIIWRPISKPGSVLTCAQNARLRTCNDLPLSQSQRE